MTKAYNPDDKWTYWEVSNLGEACVEHILHEIARVFWNVHQRDWDQYEDPKLAGIEYRPYYWGDDEEEAYKPNLKSGDLEIRWYKHPGRGMSVNKFMSPKDWHEWLNAVIEALQLENAKPYIVMSGEANNG